MVMIIIFRLIREILLKQKLFKGDDLKKLTDSTNDNVKKISIIEHEIKEVSYNGFSILLNLFFIFLYFIVALIFYLILEGITISSN